MPSTHALLSALFVLSAPPVVGCGDDDRTVVSSEDASTGDVDGAMDAGSSRDAAVTDGGPETGSDGGPADGGSDGGAVADAGLDGGPDTDGGPPPSEVEVLAEGIPDFTVGGDRIFLIALGGRDLVTCPLDGACALAPIANRSILVPAPRPEGLDQRMFAYGERLLVYGVSRGSVDGLLATSEGEDGLGLERVGFLPLSTSDYGHMAAAGDRIFVEVREWRSRGYQSTFHVADDWTGESELELEAQRPLPMEATETRVAANQAGDLLVWRELADRTSDVRLLRADGEVVELPALAEEPIPSGLYLDGGAIVWSDRTLAADSQFVAACDVASGCETVGRSTPLIINPLGATIAEDRFYFGSQEGEAGVIVSCPVEGLLDGACEPRVETPPDFQLFALRRLVVTDDAFIARNQISNVVRVTRR